MAVQGLKHKNNGAVLPRTMTALPACAVQFEPLLNWLSAHKVDADNRQHNGFTVVKPVWLAFFGPGAHLGGEMYEQNPFFPPTHVQSWKSYLCFSVVWKNEPRSFDDGHVREAQLVRGLNQTHAVFPHV